MIQLVIACLVGKLVTFILKIFGHAATTWPGHIALKIEPNLLSMLESRLAHGSILITGTNGKTTTASMLAHTFNTSGFEVVHNQSSANLLNGIASSLVLSAKLYWGYPQFGDKSVGVFEVDEAVFSKALRFFTPEVIVLLNLSRDQLDRHAEVGLLVRKWQKALAALKEKAPRVIFFENDSHLKEAVSGLRKDVLFPVSASYPISSPPATPAACAGGRGNFPNFFYQNQAAAIKAVSFFGISAFQAQKSLASFRPVFGRGEELRYKSCSVKIFLAKNPQSFNENLRFLKSSDVACLPARQGRQPSNVLVVLNDNIPDGRDVSWIYDIDLDLLKKVLKDKKVYVSGKRAYDMALRLKYAEIEEESVVIDASLKRILDKAAAESASLIVLPTYSAMLEVRKIIVGRKLR